MSNANEVTYICAQCGSSVTQSGWPRGWVIPKLAGDHGASSERLPHGTVIALCSGTCHDRWNDSLAQKMFKR